MKSETKNFPNTFVDDHDYIKNIVISIKDKISFFPDIEKQEREYYQDRRYRGISQDIEKQQKGSYKELYYNDLVSKINEQYPSAIQMIIVKEDGATIYIVKKEWKHSYWKHSSSHAIFICEASDEVSVSQIKMEFNSFIDGFEKAVKGRKLFSSIFDW